LLAFYVFKGANAKLISSKATFSGSARSSMDIREVLQALALRQVGLPQDC
jgi:hypothetical protein